MPKTSIKFKPAQKISDFKAGKIIKNKGSEETYLVNENYGKFAVATKTYVIMNPDEWMTIEDSTV